MLTKLGLAAGFCLLLSACGATTKTTTTEISEDGSTTRTTEVEHFPPLPKRERVIYDGRGPVTVIETDPNSVTEDLHDELPSGTHVRLPGLHVDSDEHADTLHVRAPFLTVNKNGPGDKIKIRAPFVRINTD